MSYISKEEIERIVKLGDKNNYSHVLICLDHFDYDYFTRYISYNENIQEVISEIQSQGSAGMFSIEEVYNYNLDIEKQLKEHRSYHIEPIPKKEKNSKTKEAIEFATEMHKGQLRKDKTPYIQHPIRVANYVSKFKKSGHLDTLIICAYLHDTLEDTKATYYQIVELFGPQIASIVLELTTDKDLKNEIGKERYLEIKMKNMSSWAFTIKLCDRLDNVFDLINTEKNFRKKYTDETIRIIEFIIKNRTLSLTQINIIIQIIRGLFYLDPLDEIKNQKLDNMINEIKEIIPQKKINLKKVLKKQLAHPI